MFFGKYSSVRSVGFLNIGSVSYKKKEKTKNFFKPHRSVLNNGFLANYFISQQEFSDSHEDIKETVAQNIHFRQSLKKIGFVPVLTFVKQALFKLQKDCLNLKKSEHRDLILINKKGVFPIKFYLSGFLVGKFAKYFRFRPRNLSAKRRIGRVNLRHILVRKLSKTARSLKKGTLLEKRSVLLDARKKMGNFFFFEGVYNLMSNNVVDLGIVKQGSVYGHSNLCNAGALQKAFLTNNNYLSLIEDHNAFFSEHYAVTVNNSTREENYIAYKMLKTRLQNSIFTRLQSIIQPVAFLKKHMSQTNMRYLYTLSAGRFRLATLQRLSLELVRKMFISVPFQTVTFSYRRTLYKYVKTNKRRIIKLIALAKRRRYYTIVKCYNRFFFGQWGVLTKKRRRYRYKARRRIYKALRRIKFKNKLLFFFYRLVKNIKYIVRQYNLYPLLLTGVAIARITRVVMFSALKTFKHYTFFLALKRQLLFTSVNNRRQSVAKLKGVPVKFRLFFSNKTKSLVHFVQNSKHYLTGNKKRLLHLTRIFVKQFQFGRQYKFKNNLLKGSTVFSKNFFYYSKSKLFYSRLVTAQRRRIIKLKLIYVLSRMRHYYKYLTSLQQLNAGFKKFVETNYKKVNVIGKNFINKRNDYFLKFFSWSLFVQKDYFFKVLKKKIKYYRNLTVRLTKSLKASWVAPVKKKHFSIFEPATRLLIVKRLQLKNKVRSLNFRKITFLDKNKVTLAPLVASTNQNTYKRVSAQFLKRLFKLNVLVSLNTIGYLNTKRSNLAQLLLKKRLQMYIKNLTVVIKRFTKQVKKSVKIRQNKKSKLKNKGKLSIKITTKKKVLKFKKLYALKKKVVLLQSYMFLKSILNACTHHVFLLKNRYIFLVYLQNILNKFEHVLKQLPETSSMFKKIVVVVSRLKTVLKTNAVPVDAAIRIKKVNVAGLKKKEIYSYKKHGFSTIRRLRFFASSLKNFTARYKLFQLFKIGLRFRSFGLLKNIFVFPKNVSFKKLKKAFKKLRGSRLFLSLPNRLLQQQYGPLFVLLKVTSLAILKNMVALYFTFLFSNPRLLLFFSLKESLLVKTVGFGSYFEKTLSFQTIHSVFYSFLLDYLYTASKYGKIAKKNFLGHRFVTFKKMKPKYW